MKKLLTSVVLDFVTLVMVAQVSLADQRGCPSTMGDCALEHGMAIPRRMMHPRGESMNSRQELAR